MSCSTARLLLSSAFTLLLAGCGATLPHTASTPTPAITYSGRVHGGQQPVSGAQIQLYTVGTAGDGSASTPLLTGTVTSDANGNFNITGLYSCSAATEVYLVATGGNPGLSATNPNLALMTALGPCASLTPQSFIAVNELTTVAAVYTLQPFFTDAAHLGSAAADAPSLAAAFTLANQLVSSSTGAITSTPGLTTPAAQLNTLADILAACINTTGGTAGDPSPCGQLFTLTSPTSGPSPTNTLNALLNIAQTPTANVAQLYNLVPAVAPYQPSTPLPPQDLALQQTPSANTASSLQVGPPTLTFPGTSLGVTSPAETVVVSNNTSNPVSLTSITLNGLNPGDFAQTTTCTATLAPASNCTVSITFTPEAAAGRQANLVLTSNTPDSPQQVSLAGGGVAVTSGSPHAVLSAVLLQPYPGASFDVTLANTGSAPLAIDSISLANTPFNTQSNNCPASLATGLSCIISIHSIAAGADQLTVTTNDPDLPPSIPIFGPAQTPVQVFSPSDLFFTDTQIGSNRSLTSSFSFASASPNLTISGPQASDFAFTTPSCAKSYIYAYFYSCTATISFTPSATGSRFARLTFDASGNYIPLEGIGTSSSPSSQIWVDPISSSLDNTLGPQLIFLSNYANSAVPIQSITIESPIGSSEISQTNTCGTSLGPQQPLPGMNIPGVTSCLITVTSSRRTEGGTQALLRVITDQNTYDTPLSNMLYPVINLGSTFASNQRNNTSNYPLQDQPVARDSDFWGGVDSPFSNGDGFGFVGCQGFITACVGDITFSPDDVGLRMAVLTTTVQTYGSPTSTNQYAVLGTGVATQSAANLILAQTGFPSLVSEQAGITAQGNLTITNPGPSTVNLGPPVITGPQAQDFQVDTPGYCIQAPYGGGGGWMLPAGTQCTSVISVQPTQTGLSTATATFTDSNSGQSFSVPLYAATIARPSLYPNTLVFHNTTINTVSPPQSITVTRPITHPITAYSSNEIIATKSSCAAGENPCVLTFVYAPTSFQAPSSIDIQDTAFETNTSLNINANAVTPPAPNTPAAASISATSLIFPAQTAGTTSLPQTLTLTNEGVGILDISTLGLTGANANEFTETSTCYYGLALEANCTISITFAPSTSGAKTATLTINGPPNSGLPLSVSLSGTAQ